MDIYTFGNTFEYETPLGTQEAKFIMDNGHEEGRYVMKATTGIQHVDKIGKLSGITAEFLAELAREKDEDLQLDFNLDTCFITNGLDGSKLLLDAAREDDETPAQFFLRVAVERGYIDKSLTNYDT